MIWKILFISGSVVMVYFSYGIASQGGMWAFFVGAAVGATVCYLYTRAKQEAIANANNNTQNVNISLNQHKFNIGGQQFTEQQFTAIAEIVDMVVEKKQLVQQSGYTLPNNGGSYRTDLTEESKPHLTFRDFLKGK